MVNHPNRRQVRLSLSVAELQALADLVLFAKQQGYHPMTAYAQAHDPNNGTLSLVTKVYATMKGIVG